MINPSFTRGEYWLLETVAEVALPICWLDWAEMEEALNKTGHGMVRPLLVDTMHKLFSEGLIAAHLDDLNDCLVLSSEQIEAALDESQNCKGYHYYGLTKKGGEYWEAFASPNWKYYIDCGFELPEDDNEYMWAGEIICMTKEHLEGYFESLIHYQYNVNAETVQWDFLEPWKATYWKELPIGHRVKFRCKDKEGIFDQLYPNEQLWYDKLWCHWK